MNLKELVCKTRSYRRFKQAPISSNTLRYLVDLARQTASGGNKQPLKYKIINDPDTCAKVFPHTAWAASLKDWPGPDDKQRPTAYIVILLDKAISNNAGQDVGIAAQTVALGAMEKNLGTCMIGSLNREKLQEELELPERYEIKLVLALGLPDETVVVEIPKSQESTAYYRDANDVHHVPKRSLQEVVV